MSTFSETLSLSLIRVLHSDSMVTLTEYEHGIVELQLNRPAAKNALNGEMIVQLTGAVKEVHHLARKNLYRMVCITGAGDFFCAGADLRYMKEEGERSLRANQKSAKQLSELFYLLATLPLLTLSYVQGGAFGGAVGVLCCSDLVIAQSDALFSTSEVRVGLAPALISPYLLRKLGSKAAMMMLTGEKIVVEEALRLALVTHRIATGGAGETELRGIITQLLSASPAALHETKKLLLLQLPPPKKALRDTTEKLLAKLRVSSDAREGCAAFLNKERPTWVVSLPPVKEGR